MSSLLEQARPGRHTLPTTAGRLHVDDLAERTRQSRADAIKVPATLDCVFGTALAGFLYGDRCFYGVAQAGRGRSTTRAFAPVYRFLLNKWWFDELYDFLFVKPTHVVIKLDFEF